MIEISKEKELLIANLVLPIIKDLVTPKIITILQKYKSTKIDVAKIESKFESYLTQKYEKYLVVDTLAFPNKQTLLDDLYEPLTIVTQGLNRKEHKIKINDYPEEFIPKYCRVIIEDTAGMGKSTITKKLFKSIIEKKCGIPILIELRKISESNTILNELQDQLSPLNKKVPQDIILRILNEGGFIFLFDGFDEIANINREFTINEIHKFIEKANHNFFLITSRPESSLASFGDFQKFHIQPLKRKEAYSLIKRYDKYNFKPVSSKLIQELEKIRTETRSESHYKDGAIDDFLKNPLLTSLLFRCFDHKKDIPIKKTEFYWQIFDAFFEAHDFSKEGYLKRNKYSKLHKDDFDRVLRYLGYFTAKENRIDYDHNYIINTLDTIKKYLFGLDFKSGDFVKDLLETVPLFKQEGLYVKWSHKSIQDYYAAKFIWIDSKESQEKILNKMYSDFDNKRFYNIIDLFCELDPETFESTFLYWFLLEFEKHVETKINIEDISDSALKTRMTHTFLRDFAIVITKEEDYDTISKGELDPEKEKLIFEYYRNKTSENFYLNFEGTYFYYFKKPKVIAQTYRRADKNKLIIMRLIAQKEPNIISYVPHTTNLDELPPQFQQDNIYLVDNTAENTLLNSRETFELTNYLTDGGMIINYDNALKRLQKIKEKKINISKDELLDW